MFIDPRFEGNDNSRESKSECQIVPHENRSWEEGVRQ